MVGTGNPHQTDELLGIFDRKSSEYLPVDDAEQCRVRADPECERQHGHGSPAFALEQHPGAIAQILEHFFLQTARLHRQRIPNRAHAETQKTSSSIPIGSPPPSKQRFSMMKLSFPLLLPLRPEPARNDPANGRDKPEVRSEPVAPALLLIEEAIPLDGLGQRLRPNIGHFVILARRAQLALRDLMLFPFRKDITHVFQTP